MCIDLALQGGGSHGAFTWGVLDRLLEEKKLRIEGISGTSAGAINAVVLADGYTTGGPQGARKSLELFWRNVSEAACFSVLKRSPLDIMSRLFSPYDIDPFGVNPLQTILVETIDFNRLSHSSIKLFITATNVSTGRGKVFRNSEITSDVLLASACLPTMFKAVEINGDYYWDGGYSGNPTITPLVRECESQDTILVQINPVTRPGFPKTATDILNRLNEVSFNAVLLKELRMIALLRKLAHPEDSEGARWAAMRIHRVSSDMMIELGASSKLNAEWDFLLMLRNEGRRVAESFLTKHAKDLGKRSSFDLDVLLEGV